MDDDVYELNQADPPEQDWDSEFTEFRYQVEREIAAYLRFVAAHPSVEFEVKTVLNQQARSIELGQYRKGGDRHD